MDLAFTTLPARGDVDLLLCDLSDRLIADGLRPAGIVQINRERINGPCDMDIRILPDGPELRISQSLGSGARGCRLDAGALEEAAARVMAELPKADCLVVNKFGKHEAEGRGFRPVIAEALSLGLPVLVGLGALNADAFHTFAGSAATKLTPEAVRLHAWLTARLAGRLTAAS